MMKAHPLDEQGLPVVFYRRDDGETVVVLSADMAYYTSKGIIIAPKGFDSDGCTMPGVFWWSIGHPFDMQYLREAVLHDWLYRVQIYDRKTSDRIFREEMEKSAKFVRDTVRIGILEDNPEISDKELDKEYKKQIKKVKVLSNAKIRAIYWGLRVGGWVAWNKHKKENAKERAA